MRISVVIDSVDPDRIAAFWQTALGYRPAGAVGASYLVLADPAGPPAPVLVLQRVAEPRSGKNRVHLDVHPQDVPAQVAALEALGGRRLGPPVTELLAEAGIWWQVMADPEGNELCVVADPGHPAPVP